MCSEITLRNSALPWGKCTQVTPSGPEHTNRDGSRQRVPRTSLKAYSAGLGGKADWYSHGVSICQALGQARTRVGGCAVRHGPNQQRTPTPPEGRKYCQFKVNPLQEGRFLVHDLPFKQSQHSDMSCMRPRTSPAGQAVCVARILRQRRCLLPRDKVKVKALNACSV